MMKRWAFKSKVTGRTHTKDFSSDFRACKPMSSPVDLDAHKFSATDELSSDSQSKIHLPLPLVKLRDKGEKYIVVTWGSGKQGALGQGGTKDCHTPTLIPSLSGKNVVQIACGAGSTVLLTSDRKLYSWGFNIVGQLGLNDFTDRKGPCEIKELSNKTIWKIAAGAGHCMGLTAKGQVYSWGCGGYYQTGHKTQENIALPRLMELEGFVNDISCGISHSLLLKGKAVIAVGDNQHGQCSGNELFYTQFTTVKLGNVIQVAAGGAHSLMLTGDKAVFSVGLNNCGQLGIGKNNEKTHQPCAVIEVPKSKTELKGIIKISAGEESSGALTAGHQLLVWGWNASGQLGQGHFSNLYYPTVMDVPKIKDFTLGVSASGAITESGELFSCGWVGEYKSVKTLGIFNKKYSDPSRVFENGVKCLALEFGRTHSVACLQQEKRVIERNRPGSKELLKEPVEFDAERILRIEINEDSEPLHPCFTLTLPKIHLRQEDYSHLEEPPQKPPKRPRKKLKSTFAYTANMLKAMYQAKEEGRQKAKSFKLYEIEKPVARHTIRTYQSPESAVPSTRVECQLKAQLQNYVSPPSKQQTNSELTSQNIVILKNKISKFDKLLEMQRKAPEEQVKKPRTLKRIGGGFQQ